MTSEAERPVAAMVRLSVIPHEDGDLVSVVTAVGGSLLIETMPADRAPRPPARDACLGCGGSGEIVEWVHGEPEPSGTFPCPSCDGTGRTLGAA